MHADPAIASASELEAWCRPGGLLDTNGDRASIHLFEPVSRRRTRDSIVEEFLAERTDVAVERQFLALATAGPPGVGKSSTIDRRHLAGNGWRVLDADVIKDYLLRDAVTCVVYEDLLDLELSDGQPVMPRELATLVHSESTKLLDAITEICMARGKTWLVSDAMDAGYLVHLHIIIVPVELSVQRVAERVRRGGHDVPEHKIRERYERVWTHLGAAIDVADVVDVFDNGSAHSPFRLCATYSHGALIGTASWPKWAPIVLRDRGKAG